MQDGDEQDGQWLAEVDQPPGLGVAEDGVGVAQVGVDNRGASPVLSARAWASTIGSLSTYTTCASGVIAWATWCTLPLVGRPVPRSRNCRIPASAARYRTARPRNARLARAASATPGVRSVTFS